MVAVAVVDVVAVVVIVVAAIVAVVVNCNYSFACSSSRCCSIHFEIH